MQLNIFIRRVTTIYIYVFKIRKFFFLPLKINIYIERDVNVSNEGNNVSRLEMDGRLVKYSTLRGIEAHDRLIIDIDRLFHAEKRKSFRVRGRDRWLGQA